MCVNLLLVNNTLKQSDDAFGTRRRCSYNRFVRVVCALFAGERSIVLAASDEVDGNLIAYP